MRYVITEPAKLDNFGLIPLTHGMVAIVDLDDFERLKKYTWHARKSFARWYAMRRVVSNGREHWIRMHREIMHTPHDQITHHKKHRTMDNRKSMLENMTQKDHKFLHETKFPGRVPRLEKKP